MKISVLTPTYNRGELLKRLYESLVKNIRTGVEIEWLIMNDGSTDNTKEIVDKFIEENKDLIKDSFIEQDRRNSAIPMLDMRNINARIEPGCFIRENVSIGDNAVIGMGSVVVKDVDANVTVAGVPAKKLEK